jgi:CubicO group peptidase (beta-lactamase class C family)
MVHLALIAALGATLAACSDDESAGSGTTAPPSATTQPAAQPAETTVAASITSPVITTATEPAATATDPPEPTETAATDTTAADATRALFASIDGDTPGCTVAVARDGRLVFAEAYGAASLEPSMPMTTATVVDIGSTSKQFTATAIALLAERGLVDVAAPLSTYISGLPTWADRVTVDRLIHHQSGIPDYIGLLNASGVETTEPSTEADALQALAGATELEFEPGTRFSYSNSNYFLLSQVVLAATGSDLGSFLAMEVFEPLGLEAVMDPTAVIDGKASSYGRVGDEWVNADSPWEQLGDGAIQTTPTQLVTWASEYWSPTIGGADINARRLVDAVDDPQIGGRYGYGIVEAEVAGRRVLTHAGGWGGFVTTFVVSPDDRVAVAGTCAAAESVPLTDDLDVGFTILEQWAV